MSEWTDISNGYGLSDEPYIAVNGRISWLWVGNLSWTRSDTWGTSNAVMDAALRTNLPVYGVRTDYRRNKPYKWERIQ